MKNIPDAKTNVGDNFFSGKETEYMSYFESITPGTVEDMPKGQPDGLPAGLLMAFAQDTDALVRFTNLTTEAQDDLIKRARSVRTKNEMRRLVSSIESSPTLM